MNNNSSIPFVPVAAVITALYLSQGLPGGLIAHALPVFLREEGVSLALIGSLKLLALPWLLKFLWAPYVDGRGTFTRRYRWILVMQSGAVIALLGLSFTITQVTTQFLILSVLCLLLLNLVSATQDIATDGITASLTPDTKLGIANSIQVSGYKIGMLIGGSGLLFFSDFVPLTELMRYLALLLVVLLVPLVMFNRVYRPGTQSGIENSVTDQSESDHKKISVWATYKGFVSQPSVGLWLLVLVTYKLSDSFGSAMFKPMLVDQGIERAVIGELTLLTSLIGLVGALVGGWAYKALGQHKVLVLFCLLQGVSVSSFYFLSVYEMSLLSIYWFSGFEQFCDGLSTVALFAVMMAHCRAGHEGADYTLQASIQIVLAGMLGATSGMLAGLFGYSLLYIMCAVLSILSLVIVIKYCRDRVASFL